MDHGVASAQPDGKGLQATAYRVGNASVEEFRFDYRSEPPLVFDITEATLPAGMGLVASGCDIHFVGPGWFAQNFSVGEDHTARAYPRPPNPPRINIPEAGYMMFGSKVHGWRLMALAEVAVLADMLPSADIPLVAHMKCLPGPLEEAAIRHMGISNPIVNVSKPFDARVGLLHVAQVPHYWRHDGMMNCPAGLQVLRKKLGVPSEPKKPHEAVYFSRRDAPWRHISNENEVLPLLERYGFRTIEFTRLSMAERLETLQNASVIVGQLGSNMTNTLLAPSGAWVIELVPVEWESWKPSDCQLLYWSESFGQRNVRVPCRSEGLGGPNILRNNVHVPVDGLAMALEFVRDQSSM